VSWGGDAGEDQRGDAVDPSAMMFPKLGYEPRISC